MNKRGQIFILAAIILSIAIFSVMKVTNRFNSPVDDNFDFFVENFQGERSYVMNLGILEGEDCYSEDCSVGGGGEKESLLEVFQSFGVNTGIVLVEYDMDPRDSPPEGNGVGRDVWIITNYLGEDVIAASDCEDCASFSIPSAEDTVAEVSFSVAEGGKKWNPPSDEVTIGDGYFSKIFDEDGIDTLKLVINENEYIFQNPVAGKAESLIFRNVAKDYVRVVKL